MKSSETFCVRVSDNVIKYISGGVIACAPLDYKDVKPFFQDVLTKWELGNDDVRITKSDGYYDLILKRDVFIVDSKSESVHI